MDIYFLKDSKTINGLDIPVNNHSESEVKNWFNKLIANVYWYL